MFQELNKFELDIFESYCPIIKREAIRIFKTEDDQLIAELKDGSAVQYDLVLNTTRGAISLDILMRPKQATNEESFKKFLSRKLYREMLRKGYNQQNLSEKTGIPESTISRYICEVSIPSVYKLKLIADALNVTIDELLIFDC